MKYTKLCTDKRRWFYNMLPLELGNKIRSAGIETIEDFIQTPITIVLQKGKRIGPIGEKLLIELKNKLNKNIYTIKLNHNLQIINRLFELAKIYAIKNKIKITHTTIKNDKYTNEHITLACYDNEKITGNELSIFEIYYYGGDFQIYDKDGIHPTTYM